MLRPLLIIIGCLTAAVAATAVADDGPLFDLDVIFTVEYPNGYSPTSTAAGDFDGDGLADLVVSSRNRDLGPSTLRGRGDGSFFAPDYIPLEVQTDWVVVSDFNHDGHDDIALAARAGLGSVIVLYGDGTGAFPDREDVALGRLPTNLLAVDLDGDSYDDLVALNYFDDALVTVRNQPQGMFALGQWVPLSTVFSTAARPIYAAATDLDRDNDLDILVSHLASGKLSILSNDGTGRLAAPVHFPVGVPVAIVASDADLDGDQDILMTDMTDFEGSLVALSNNEGVFSATGQFVTGGWAWHLAAIDLDGDGDDDVVVSNPSSGMIHLLGNTGAGSTSFTAGSSLTVGSFARHVLAVDVDDDCAVDIAVTDIGAHRVAIVGNATPQEGSCAAGDLNFDERVDTGDLLLGLVYLATTDDRGDVDGNGLLSIQDILLILREWSP